MRSQSGNASEATEEDSDVSSTGSDDPVLDFPTVQENLKTFYEEWKREVNAKKQSGPSSSTRSSTYSMPSDQMDDVRDHTIDDVASRSDAICSDHGAANVCRDSDTPSGPPFIQVQSFPTTSIQHDLEEQKQSGAHISDLPRELLLCIFRWAVGNHLDTRVLGKLACVCKAFHSLAYDPSLWRAICFRQWPVLAHISKSMYRTSSRKGKPSQRIVPQTFGYLTWHEMAIRKPHILFDGCYLGRISYCRMGEATFTDYYRPVHLVVYYRGIRFHTDGRVEMLTSSCDPHDVVDALGGKQNKTSATSGNNPNESETTPQTTTTIGLLRGRYEWEEPNVITCTLQRPTVREKVQPMQRYRFHQNLSRVNTAPVEVTFTIRFRLTSSKRRLHNVLKWESYVIHTVNSLQTRTSTRLDVSSNQFPPCYYSRVRSYTRQVSTEPV